AGPARGRLAAGWRAGAPAVALLATGAPSLNSWDTVLAGVGAVLGVAAVVIAAPLIASPVARIIAAPMAHGRRAAVTVHLARDNSACTPHRTAATAAILTIGLAAAGVVSILTTSARASAQDAIGAT